MYAMKRGDATFYVASDQVGSPRVVTDAVEIGARVLDREQAAANTEFVKTEFERASRELQVQFTEHAGKVAERLDQKVDEVFGEEDGDLAKELEKLFSDGSSVVMRRERVVFGAAASDASSVVLRREPVVVRRVDDHRGLGEPHRGRPRHGRTGVRRGAGDRSAAREEPHEPGSGPDRAEATG